MQLIKAITYLRLSKRWTQSKLASKSGVSQTYISELESGKKNPTIVVLQKLSKALNVPIIKLLSDKSA